jgi:hypothetical protein
MFECLCSAKLGPQNREVNDVLTGICLHFLEAIHVLVMQLSMNNEMKKLRFALYSGLIVSEIWPLWMKTGQR